MSDLALPDDLVRAALTGPQAAFATTRGHVVRFEPSVAPFSSVPREPERRDWNDLAALSGAGTHTALRGAAGLIDTLPGGWDVAFNAECVLMVATDALKGDQDDEAVVLTGHDVPEMLDLVKRTQPGPFLPRTHELGLYLGLRQEGKLVAMAGERMRVPGFTEISAVCTDPAYRGRGLGGRLLKAVAHAVRDRGDVPYLHAVTTNPALSLYEKVGFETVGSYWFFGVVPPVEAA